MADWSVVEKGQKGGAVPWAELEVLGKVLQDLSTLPNKKGGAPPSRYELFA